MDPLPCQDGHTCLPLISVGLLQPHALRERRRALRALSPPLLLLVSLRPGDGHGPFGHLASFRVAQSLPDALRAPDEAALLAAFRHAAGDLAAHAARHRLDLGASGCGCCALLLHGQEALIAWLGDCRALVATVAERSHVDLVTAAHTTEDVRELQRVRNAGARLIQAWRREMWRKREVPPNSGHVGG